MGDWELEEDEVEGTEGVGWAFGNVAAMLAGRSLIPAAIIETWRPRVLTRVL